MNIGDKNLDDVGDLASTIVIPWKAFLVEGVILVILGLAALAIPVLASVATTIFVGWVFLVGGLAGVVVTFSARDKPGVWWGLLSAMLGIAAGILLIGRPVQGTVTLTIVTAAYFIFEGFSSIMFGLGHRQTASWLWMIAAGIVDFIVAAMIILGLPQSAEWAIGLLVGINFLFGGCSLIGMALSARNPTAWCDQAMLRRFILHVSIV
ncbi:MAG: hypothetical protein CFE29_28290 [Bradyrhizobiaceae bacterium PARB1]|nr:MAG: hypothetical protein CFE29_28290 [Bradyrhizobiaceae bacterium PARB1]